MAKGNFFFLYFVVALMLAHGSRSTEKKQLASIGPEDDPWEQGAKYACMQKYNGRGEEQEQFCLAKIDQLFEVRQEHTQFAKDWRECESEEDPHTMKVCALKGRGRHDLRISMHSKEDVPKSCFHAARDETLIIGASRIFASFADPADFYDNVKNKWLFHILQPHMEKMTGVKANSSMEARAQWTLMFLEIIQKIYHVRREDVSILEAAVTEPLCQSNAQLDAHIQSIFVPRLPKTTLIEEPPEEPPICEARDGYEPKVSGKECIYEPAPCKILGAIGDGLECRCHPKLTGTIEWMGAIPLGECFVEIVHLFNEETRWEYNGKSIKCCVSSLSSDDKPTQIVDMNAEPLPHARSVGLPTGCGRMFGDTYHNGLKWHLPEPTCLVAMKKVMDMTGMDFATVLSLVPYPLEQWIDDLSESDAGRTPQALSPIPLS